MTTTEFNWTEFNWSDGLITIRPQVAARVWSGDIEPAAPATPDEYEPLASRKEAITCTYNMTSWLFVHRDDNDNALLMLRENIDNWLRGEPFAARGAG